MANITVSAATLLHEDITQQFTLATTTTTTTTSNEETMTSPLVEEVHASSCSSHVPLLEKKKITSDISDSDSEQAEDESLLFARRRHNHSEVKNENGDGSGCARILLNQQQEFKWPDLFNDRSAIDRNELRPLRGDLTDVQKNVEECKTITVRSITWNQQAQDFPSVEMLQEHLLLPSYFHLVAVGTQECENTITKSILYSSKSNWEKLCLDALGYNYELVRGHSLQASHLALYAHRSILHLISEVESTAVATGFCDKLGNKGGLAISMKIGKTKFCFLTSHLSAHQSQMDKRTAEFAKISKEVSRSIGKKESRGIDSSTSTSSLEEQGSKASSSGDLFQDDCIENDNFHRVGMNSNKTLTCSFCSRCTRSIRQCSLCCCPDHTDEKHNPLLNVFDHIIWGGDFNFRINGTRDVVDTLLNRNRCDVLLDNDQLTMLMQYDKTFMGFVEGPMTFRPTYKFDRGKDDYDTSSKRRIPAWTDRILYKKSSSIELLSYCSADGVKISDHRPVYASFQCSIEMDEMQNSRRLTKEILRSESRSEVCVIS